ncbi:MAG: NUDIX domain-containing protein [Propioniciclava sp.]|uniref:NUDIX hydrolase n=1 Tax=Propioniciclava sp. TaxID=2038686 RepID=UPI0039E714B7
MAVLVRRGCVLLAHRRADRAWYPDCWDLVGGHVEPGETPEDAVRRECREELGIEVTSLAGIRMMLSDPAVVAHPFLVTAWHGEPRNTAPDEHDAVTWFAPDALPRLHLADASYLEWLPGIVRRCH